MHTHDLSPWQHEHQFDAGNAGQRGTTLVAWITVAMMVIEMAAGLRYNSMALPAVGLHMSSHAVAIGLSAFAYAAARSRADLDPEELKRMTTKGMNMSKSNSICGRLLATDAGWGSLAL